MAVLNEEQRLLRDMARDWADQQSPVSAFRRLRDSGTPGVDPATWQSMANMGWAGIVIPEAHGGSNFGYLGLGLVLEESARTLTASPLAASALGAASALVLGGNPEQQARYLPGIASGELIACLAIDDGPRHQPQSFSTRASRSDDGWVLHGSKAFVAEGGQAQLLVVAAETDSGPALFLVEVDTPGLERAARHLADARDHCALQLDAVVLPEAALLGAAGDRKLLDAVLDRARIGAAAEMLGMAVQSFNLTLDYLKTRVQFDEIIARFQALQHRMARLFTEIELLRSTVEEALAAIDRDDPELPQLASLAKATANDTLHLMSREMIQLHGGIGMTDEHDAGFYLKRARVLENSWGNASFHRDRYARLCGY
ncbi:acyl-CoA dehydrogenase family protein [Parahaliea aestuarii]|uniref:Acyl-CoA dehydrogenase family protein n=1 Tax=Parahaliea aestuarii TaxID=1852021 RepID=A0A5C9A3G6_9GAMM|nr:acyl-CoA dehydrogenase family protein [Parahaliea aestuarii]TXS94482.1 acyl-CoA dehydrogenase family protein [Parahaliea aestuarii]